MEAKLAGALNLSLHLASSCIPQPSSAGNTCEESCVRPFRYLDLRYMPSQQRHAEASSKGEALTIRPQLTENDITARRNDTGGSTDTEAGSCVSIPADCFMGSKQHFFLSTLAGLGVDEIASVEKTTTSDLPSEGDRSDITGNILDFASGKWPPTR